MSALIAQTAPALELVGSQLMVDGSPVAEVVHLKAAPVVVLVTEAGAVVVVTAEEFERVTGADPLAR